MNPLSAFSFGKIIKTFIPGLIAAVSLAFVVETLHLWAQPIPGSELAMDPLWLIFQKHSYFCATAQAPSANVAVVGAIVLPLAMIIGFFLNTIHWLGPHKYFARVARKRIRDNAGLSLIEDALMAEAKLLVEVVSPGVTLDEPALQHLFLPFLDIERLNYLRESYFSWYEFQVNSAYAFMVSFGVYTVCFIALALQWSISRGSWTLYLGFPAALTALVVPILWYAARCNLVRYEERFLLFLAGSLYMASLRK